MQVDREQARMLVADVGYEEASKQTGIKAGTLRQWALRYKWKEPILHSQAKTVTTVTKPADAQLTILQQRRDKSKLHLSSYIEKASYEASSLEGRALLKQSGEVKNVAQIHQAIWPEEDQTSSPLNLQVLSQNTVIRIGGAGTKP